MNTGSELGRGERAGEKDLVDTGGGGGGGRAGWVMSRVGNDQGGGELDRGEEAGGGDGKRPGGRRRGGGGPPRPNSGEEKGRSNRMCMVVYGKYGICWHLRAESVTLLTDTSATWVLGLLSKIWKQRVI